MPESSKLNVLVVYHHLPHYRYDVFRALEDQPDLQVEFAAASESRDGSIKTIPSAALQCMHTLTNKWIGPFLWQKGLWRLILQRRFQAYIFLGDAKHMSTWTAAIFARLTKTPVFFWTIGWIRPEKGAHRLYKMAFYRLAETLLVYGEGGKALGARLGYPQNRMTVVYNSSSAPISATPIEPERLVRFAAALPPEGEQVLGAVLRLNPEKQLAKLIEACAQLRSEGREVSVLLVGEGSDKTRLRDLARDLGVPLWLPGPAYTDEELALAYQRITVTVIPSAAGLSVLQSFKFGRPVITHDAMREQGPEFEAIVSGVNGDIYPNGRYDVMLERITTWLDRQALDSEATAVQCRKVLEEKWNPQNQADIIGTEIRRLVSRHAKRQ